ncbi:hypothetical protein MKW94_024658 [Papaver nudicaule]|uniref:TF-B3 domain-containing protein n=1 Tax=Papaver nudicaule TaxID=74823 RepID=A0AA41UW59_PAPNU|nr:hypothetical protein [Papaver nudicaule]
MEKIVESERKYHFFKILIEEEYETRMLIPKAFYHRISIESQSCERAVVQGPSGEYWVIKVNKSEDGIFLENGWEVFVRENGLQMFDFLVIRYDGSMQFSVKVFNMKGVPREECFAPVRSSPLGEKRIRCGNSSGCQPVGMSSISLRLRERHFVEQQQHDTYESDDDKSFEDELDEDHGEDEIPKKTLDMSSSRKTPAISNNRKRYVARADEIERGFASSSNYPFFRIILHHSYLNKKSLAIPEAARRSYFTDDLEKVIVKASDNSDKRLWEIGLHLDNPTDMRLTKGVSRFISKENGMNLKVGDVCIFEIVEKRSNQLVLQVHVYHN